MILDHLWKTKRIPNYTITIILNRNFFAVVYYRQKNDICWYYILCFGRINNSLNYDAAKTSMLDRKELHLPLSKTEQT
jgi:hypothetical protein